MNAVLKLQRVDVSHDMAQLADRILCQSISLAVPELVASLLLSVGGHLYGLCILYMNLG